MYIYELYIYIYYIHTCVFIYLMEYCLQFWLVRCW